MCTEVDVHLKTIRSVLSTTARPQNQISVENDVPKNDVTSSKSLDWQSRGESNHAISTSGPAVPGLGMIHMESKIQLSIIPYGRNILAGAT